jgi:hypothetical protein
MCRMERVWDEADYVVPAAENGAFFVTTNIIVTPNQTWGSCPEVSRLRQTKPGAAVQRWADYTLKEALKGKQLFEVEQLILIYFTPNEI